jgi:hypothetical protein
MRAEPDTDVPPSPAPARVGVSERARWLLLVLSLITAFSAMVAAGIFYTNHVERTGRAETAKVQREAQQDFCDLMRVFDDPAAPPPSTERGRRQVEAIRAYLARRC